MYANILLSTDGSDVARKGVKHGIALAKALNAKVTVITVTEPLPYGSVHTLTSSRETVDRYDAACKEHAGKVLDEARALAKKIGITAELLHVPNANAATAIIETANSRGCDLIVMASHGQRGLGKLMGSSTSEVLANGSVPVLVSLHSTTRFMLDCKLDGTVVSPATASETVLKTPKFSPFACPPLVGVNAKRLNAGAVWMYPD